MDLITLVVTVVVFLGVLSFLVLIHEAGHFFSARFFKIKVEEFGLGYPPRAKTLARKNGVEYTLNWLPFGGFVRLGGEVLENEEERVGDASLFYNQAWWKKLIVILAGAAINFLYGVLAFGVLFSILGIPEGRGVEIVEIADDSPAVEAGLEVGDKVVAVENGELVEVTTTDEFVAVLSDLRGEEVDLYLAEAGGEEVKQVYIRREDEVPEGEGSIGVVIQASELEFVKYPWWQRPFRGIKYGLETAFEFSGMILKVFGGMIGDIFTKGKVPEDVAGPVGIVNYAYKERVLDEGLIGLLNWSAVLSIQLAIINVLPIPAMDGGRAVFILVEKAMGKRYRPEFEHKAVMVGMLFLLGLIVLISLKDIGVVLRDSGIL